MKRLITSSRCVSIIMLACIIIFSCVTSKESQEVPAVATDAKSLEVVLDDFSAYIAERLPNPTLTAVAITETPTQKLGDYIADELTNSLLNRTNLRMVSRRDFERVLAEQNIQTGLNFNDDTTARIGHNLGWQIIIFGAIESLPDVYRLSLRAVNVETGELRGSRSYLINRNDPVLASFEIPGVARTAPRPVPDGGFIRIQGGTFSMGSPANESGRDNNENPQRQVTLSSFYMAKHIVTQKQFNEVMGRRSGFFRGDDLPVEMVNWFDAVEYCNRLSSLEGLSPAYMISGTSITWNRNSNGYRLPTEAEWEYACRAGTVSAYNTGAIISDSVGWYEDNSEDKTHQPGQKPANPWGLFDMHGNVYEWCWDWYGNYPRGAQTNPVGASDGNYRVYRGGSYRSSAEYLRSASRNAHNPSRRFNNLGFRVVFNGNEDAPASPVQNAASVPPVRPSSTASSVSRQAATASLSVEEQPTGSGLIYAIGETGPAGGIVFYDKGSYSGGWRYMEAAPVDFPNAQWGLYQETVAGLGTEIGSGKRNTEIILVALGEKGETARAAQLCVSYNLNGYNDWFLPSRDELNALYNALGENNLGGFSNDSYWTSSPTNLRIDVWVQRMSDGYQSNGLRNYARFSTRAIRTF